MNIIHAIILGTVQGLTEFVPVSSSGHLVLLHRVFGINEPTLFFDVMLHIGTLLAVFIVLWRDIWGLLRRPIQGLTGFLILGTLPIVFAALFFRKPLEEAFTTGQFLGFAFLMTSAILCIAERLIRKAKKAEAENAGADKAGTIGTENPWQTMTWKDALAVGAMQAIAIIPGLSRSGATITGALGRKLNRDLAARFSFLLSIPAILGALVLQLMELARGGDLNPAAGIGIGAFIAGTISAAIVGFFAVRFMLKIIREKSLFYFALYTAVLGILVLIDQFGTHFFF